MENETVVYKQQDLERIEKLCADLRKVAAPVGPQHSWWDMLFEGQTLLESARHIFWDFVLDGENLCHGGSPRSTVDVGRWIAHAEAVLKSVRFDPRLSDKDAREGSLRELVRKALVNDIMAEPEFWAGWIEDQMTTDAAVEYLDLDRRTDAREIIERLGFDPREPEPAERLKREEEWLRAEYERLSGGCLCGHTESCRACDGTDARQRQVLEQRAKAL